MNKIMFIRKFPFHGADIEFKNDCITSEHIWCYAK